MKTIEVKVTTLELRKLTGKVIDEGKFADTLDLIETTLDNIPQGGFTPKDIRDRNRISMAIEKYREDKKDKEIPSGRNFKPPLKIEDSDYENVRVIVNSSRWGSRDKILQEFLDSFKD